jgi:hypothetical protein
VVEVSEVSRTGQPVRTARFMASRVVAIVEHPTEDGDEEAPSRGARIDPDLSRLDLDA